MAVARMLALAAVAGAHCEVRYNRTSNALKYNLTTLTAGVAEAVAAVTGANSDGEPGKAFWPFALRHFMTPVAGYYICDHYVGGELEGYEMPPPDGSPLEATAASLASVKPLASVYVTAKRVTEFAEAILPLLRVPVILLTGGNELPQVEKSNWTESLRTDPRIVHWFSQNPLYPASSRYSGLTYGLHHHSILAYARALLKQARGGAPAKTRGLSIGYVSKHRMNGWMRAGLPAGPKLDHDAYYDLLAGAEHVLSPCGDRCDTYRNAEAIGLGAVPATNAPEHLYRPGLYEDSALFFDARRPQFANSARKDPRKHLPRYAEPDRGLVHADYWRHRIRAVRCYAAWRLADHRLEPPPRDPTAEERAERREPYKAELGWLQFAQHR